ncbi:hypothetical protein [Rhodococcus sp. LW-XY12]|uniref:hypothetical protein n=1 Tax=Rhodococcus sp. LW-XY12 TaxID=2856851 RepID=UPI001C595A70|nr:hypothetical protein [Rhodococcus sp. LW-XY12]QXU55201.1 hypothetical protein KXC42_08250 [Rhodococcus sp. LW-XY12]
MAITTLGFTDGAEVSILIGSTEYKEHLKNARFDNEDGDARFVTFASAASGDGRWLFRAAAFQSFKSSSFWRYVWDNAGSPAVITLAPYGNETPTVAEPHYRATATIGKKPSVGGEANTEWDFEVEWECVDPPVEITTDTP